MFSEGEALGDEVVVDYRKGTGGEEIGGDVEITGISCSLSECSGGEAMGWDVGEGGGEDGVFGWVEGRRSFVLVGMVGSAMLQNKA